MDLVGKAVFCMTRRSYRSSHRDSFCQLAPAGKRPAARRGQGRVNSDARESARADHREVIEMGHGITVYPPAEDGARWRAAFLENGQRRFRQAATEPGLAAKLAKVTERLAAEATSMEKPGAAPCPMEVVCGESRNRMAAEALAAQLRSVVNGGNAFPQLVQCQRLSPGSDSPGTPPRATMA
jgi:hypothetical protein